MSTARARVSSKLRSSVAPEVDRRQGSPRRPVVGRVVAVLGHPEGRPPPLDLRHHFRDPHMLRSSVTPEGRPPLLWVAVESIRIRKVAILGRPGGATATCSRPAARPRSRCCESRPPRRTADAGGRICPTSAGRILSVLRGDRHRGATPLLTIPDLLRSSVTPEDDRHGWDSTTVKDAKELRSSIAPQGGRLQTDTAVPAADTAVAILSRPGRYQEPSRITDAAAVLRFSVTPSIDGRGLLAVVILGRGHPGSAR